MEMEEGRGKKKTGLLIQRRVIFSLVVELLTDVAWQRRERESEGGRNKWWAWGDGGEEVSEGEQV